MMDREQIYEFFLAHYRERGIADAEAAAEKAADDAEATVRAILPGDQPKVATTAELRAMNDEAIRRDYNRAVEPAALDDLDPDGVHLCTFAMMHDRKGGKETPTHVRGVWMLRMKGTDEPSRATLDMPSDAYMALSWVDVATNAVRPADREEPR